MSLHRVTPFKFDTPGDYLLIPAQEGKINIRPDQLRSIFVFQYLAQAKQDATNMQLVASFDGSEFRPVGIQIDADRNSGMGDGSSGEYPVVVLTPGESLYLRVVGGGASLVVIWDYQPGTVETKYDNRDITNAQRFS